MPKSKNHYIAVAGVMGSGKTSAARLLSRELGLPLLEEKPHENPFLESFYNDMPRWSLHNQLFYFLQKAQQNIEAKKLLQKTGVIHDAPLGQNIVYLETQRKLGSITGDEYGLIANALEIYKPNMLHGNPIIVLDAPVDLIMQRLKKRGMEYEKKVPRDYISMLCKFQNQWLSQYPKNKKIVVPVDKVDLRKEKDRKAFVGTVKKFIGIKN